jgi:hypothetical protein
MKRSFGPKTLYGLATMFLSFTGNCIAQDAGLSVAGCPAGSACAGQQASIAVMGDPALGGPQIGVVTTRGMGLAFQENAEVVKNQPYQAQAVTGIKQTLADGSHISQTTTATVARDSEGRTVRIQKLSAIGPWKSASDSSQANGPTLTTIFDPVAKTHTDYTSDNKIAHVLPMPPLPSAGAPGEDRGFAMFASGPGAGGLGPVTLSVQGRTDFPQPVGGRDAKAESLGAKTIEGIPVTGTKTTDTIPAGTIGNDKDLVIGRETWYSPDLKLVLQSTQTDPRFGETTYSLTNIQRNEPDPSLFQVPAGYTIEKARVMVQNH